MDIFWTFKSKLQIIHAATYIHCFFLTLINVFFICLAPYIHVCLYYFLILCSSFHFLFLTLLATRHILLFTISHSVSLQPAQNMTEIWKTLYSSRQKKKCRVNYNQNKCYNIWYKVWVFPPLYSHTYSHVILWQKIS